MKEVMNAIIELLKNYYLGIEVYVYIALACLVYLLVFEKEVRKIFIIPLILIAIVILNPILYKYIFSKTYMYWRFFWIFSLHIVIGTALICLLKRVKFDLLKIVLFIIPCFLIINYGNNAFETEEFSKTTSIEKLPYGVVQICEKMLEIEEEPLVISDKEISSYIRQYSGKIKQLWGRNADGYISSIGKMTNEYFKMFHESGDYLTVLTYAAEEGYTFIITEDDKEIEKSILYVTGYEEIYDIGEYHLYHYTGKHIVEEEGEQG